MSWFWGARKPEASSDDPYSRLDPSLRDFLDKQTPASQAPAESQREATPPTPSALGAPDTYRKKIGLDIPGVSLLNPNATPAESPAVPPQSLFQDGRYAHLWKNYRSLQDIDSHSKSDQDKLADIVDTYNTRRAAISRAAQENCVLENLAQNDCWNHGGFWSTMTMCKKESRAFTRCYVMQARFLKALGYLSMEGGETSRDEDDRVQMHADRLYHEMLDRERLVEEAKKGGKEAPVFGPLIRNQDTEPRVAVANTDDQSLSAALRDAQVSQQSQSQQAPSEFSPAKKEELRARLKGKTRQEQEIELQLFAAEHKAQLGVAMKVREYFQGEQQSRADRRERGRETVGDSIKRMWGWDG